jgi:hypothetical protein
MAPITPCLKLDESASVPPLLSSLPQRSRHSPEFARLCPNKEKEHPNLLLLRQISTDPKTVEKIVAAAATTKNAAAGRFPTTMTAKKISKFTKLARPLRSSHAKEQTHLKLQTLGETLEIPLGFPVREIEMPSDIVPSIHRPKSSLSPRMDSYSCVNFQVSTRLGRLYNLPWYISSYVLPGKNLTCFCV